MYKMTNKQIVSIITSLIGLNGFIWFIVNLFSLPVAIREFSMGLTFALVLVCAVLLFISESKRINQSK
jgi:hypothetical protein